MYNTGRRFFVVARRQAWRHYEASTLLAETLPPKQEIQDGTPAIFFLSFGVRASTHTLPEKTFCLTISRWILGVFWGGTPLRDHFLTSKVAGGRPRWLRDDFVTFFYGFGYPFGVPYGHSGGHFGAFFFETDLFKVFFSDLFVDTE